MDDQEMEPTLGGTKKPIEKLQKRGTMELFQRMCDGISIHGFSLVGIAMDGIVKKRNPSRGYKISIIKLILAVIVLFLSTGILVWYLQRVFSEYLSTYLKVSLSDPQGSLSKAYFPDITICNNNKIKMNFLLKIDSNLLKKGKKGKQLLKEINKHFITGSDEPPSSELNQFLESDQFLAQIKAELPNKAASITKDNAKGFFRQAAAPTCEDMILQAFWKNNDVTKEVLNKSETAATSFGICCNISPYKIFKDVKTIVAHPEKGFSLLIDSESYDYAYTPHNSEGFKFSASSPHTFDQVEEDGLMVQPGTNTYAAFNPRVIEIGSHRPVDYDWTPEQRKCFINDTHKMPEMKELQNRHPKLAKLDPNGDYDYRLCRELMKIDAINDQAKCTPPEYWEILNQDDELPTDEPCLGSNIKLADQIIDNMNPNISDKLCLNNCATQQNRISLSYSSYPSKAIFESFEDYKIISEKIEKAYTSKQELMDKYFKSKPDAFQYAKENVAWLTVYFKFPYVSTYSVDVAKTRSTLFAEIGGTCGLFLGVSFIGLLELFYHIFKIVVAMTHQNILE